MRRKVVRATLIIWTTLTIVWGYVYVAFGAGWSPVAAEYETRWDFRPVFFALSWLPVLLLALLIILLMERKYLSKKD
jgi:hypothetical protein